MKRKKEMTTGIREKKEMLSYERLIYCYRMLGYLRVLLVSNSSMQGDGQGDVFIF